MSHRSVDYFDMADVAELTALLARMRGWVVWAEQQGYFAAACCLNEWVADLTVRREELRREASRSHGVDSR